MGVVYKKERQSKSYLIKGIWGGIIFALFATFVLPILMFMGFFSLWLEFFSFPFSVSEFLWFYSLYARWENIGYWVSYFFPLVSNLIFYSAIGALVGWIIDKNKSK